MVTGAMGGWLQIASGGTAAPVVSIEATKRIAEEDAAPLRRINLVGEFTVSRTGSTADSLPVWIHYSGSATPGVDYTAASWLVTIPAGDSSVAIPIMALQDQVTEGIETVVATVSNCPHASLNGTQTTIEGEL